MVNGQKYNDDLVIEILKLYLEGKEIAELSREYNVAPTTIFTWAKRAGVYKKINRFRSDWIDIKNKVLGKNV